MLVKPIMIKYSTDRPEAFRLPPVVNMTIVKIAAP
jgi:hypothetical protein